MLELSTLPLEKIASSVAAQQTKKGLISLCTPIGVLLLAFLPTTIKEKYLEGKLSLRELASREEIFDKISSAISEQIKTSY